MKNLITGSITILLLFGTVSPVIAYPGPMVLYPDYPEVTHPESVVIYPDYPMVLYPEPVVIYPGSGVVYPGSILID